MVGRLDPTWLTSGRDAGENTHVSRDKPWDAKDETIDDTISCSYIYCDQLEIAIRRDQTRHDYTLLAV